MVLLVPLSLSLCLSVSLSLSLSLCLCLCLCLCLSLSLSISTLRTPRSDAALAIALPDAVSLIDAAAVPVVYFAALRTLLSLSLSRARADEWSIVYS